MADLHPLPDRRALDLLAEALEQPTAEVAAFLGRACGDDVALRQDVDRLLLAQARAADLLVESKDQIGEAPGDRIDRYKLLQKIGEGGFGTVWMADQESPVRRKVALKVLKAGLDTAQVIGRFEAERQALALMDHPNIAKVFDGGATTQGRPYFVMELVKGVPITSYCDEAGLSPSQRCELFVQVCQAVQHAHQKGVIHRDLKPSNVLVTLHDGIPVPKVIDFGIAKATGRDLTQRTVFTEFRQMLGTPEYMAPEQAEMSGLDVDTRADVYSLGVLLYELLTGTRPFELKTLLEAGYAEMVRTLKEVDPPRPSTRVSTLGEELVAVARQRKVNPRQFGALMRGDFDWIVMKALEKERGRRYDTAAALADDVLRHLRHEPVLAGPPSRLYRLRQYVRRHRVGVAAGMAIAISLVVGAAAAGWGFVRAKDREAQAVALAGLAERARAAEKLQREEAELSEAKAKSVIDLIQQMLGSSHPQEVRGKDYTVRQLLDDFDRDLAWQFDQAPEVEATLRTVMAASYLGLGLPAKAGPNLDRADALWEQASKQGSLQAGASLMLRADWMRAVGRYDEAAQILAQARSIVVRHEGLLSPILASLSHREAYVCVRLGRFDRAERLAREGVEILRGLPRNKAYALGANLSELASIVAKQGRLDEAERLAREGLMETRAILGDRHPEVAARQRDLATILSERGRLAEAEELNREALSLLVSIVGEEHPQMAWAKEGLADTLRERDQVAEAVSLRREALALRTRLQGEEHPETVTSMNNLSVMLTDKEQLAEAEALQRRALERTQRAFGEDHPDVRTCLNNLGVILSRRGKEAEAEALHREVLDKTVATLGAEHPECLRSLTNLAVALGKQGKHAEAEPLARRALDLARRIHGDEHPHVATIEGELGAILSSLGRPLEAEPLHRRSLELRRKLFGDDHSSTRTSRVSLARTLHDLGVQLNRQGLYAKAEPHLRQAAELLPQVLSDTDPRLGITRANLAQALLEQGKLEESEGLFRRSLEALRLDDIAANPGQAQHWVFALVHYAVLLRRLDRLEEGERHLRQGIELGRRLLALEPGSREAARRLRTALTWLSVFMEDRGRFAESVQILREALALATSSSGEGSAEVAHVLAWLATVLRKQGELPEAEQIARRLLGLRETLNGQGSVELGSAQITLARVLLAQQRAAEAETLARASLAIRAEKAAGSWQHSDAQAVLGRAVALQGRRAEAEPLLVEACSRMQSTPENENARREAILWLVELCEEEGRTEQAAEWRARL